MKKLLLLAAIMLASMGSWAQTVEPNNEGMTLSAQEWTRDVVMGWNLGNSLECPYTETEWGNPKTTKAMIHAVILLREFLIAVSPIRGFFGKNPYHHKGICVYPLHYIVFWLQVQLHLYIF